MTGYLTYSYASQIQDRKTRFLYRIFEIIPGALVWSTFVLMFLLAWQLPAFIAAFIIVFDILWVIRAGYHAALLHSSYRQTSQNLRTDWRAKLQESSMASSEELQHLVFLPVYTEGRKILERTLHALQLTAERTPNLHIVVALEERAGRQSKREMDSLIKKYQKSFAGMHLFIHPKDLPGEVAGKGSNLHYAGQQARAKIVDANGWKYENVIATALDADTVVPKDYFNRLSYAYLTAEKPTKSSYQPVPFFFNNLWKAPAVARVIALSTTFWYMILQVKAERRGTFSSHSIPFAALINVGFWQKNIVSEDSRIFYQNLLAHDGDYRVVPLYYPVSMDANVANGFWKTLRNQYLQQRRWAWGVENVPYLLTGFLQNKKISLREKLAFVATEFEGFYSWATASILIFFLGWLPVILGGPAFSSTVLAYNLPKITSYIMGGAMIGLVHIAFITVNLSSARYTKYFPGINPPSKSRLGRVKNTALLALQWVLLPITLNVFGAFPAIDAQTRLMLGKYLGFWTTEKQ